MLCVSLSFFANEQQQKVNTTITGLLPKPLQYSHELRLCWSRWQLLCRYSALLYIPAYNTTLLRSRLRGSILGHLHGTRLAGIRLGCTGRGKVLGRGIGVLV